MQRKVSNLGALEDELYKTNKMVNQKQLIINKIKKVKWNWTKGTRVVAPTLKFIKKTFETIKKHKLAWGSNC